MPTKSYETKIRLRTKGGGVAVCTHVSAKKPSKSDLPKIRKRMVDMADLILGVVGDKVKS